MTLRIAALFTLSTCLGCAGTPPDLSPQNSQLEVLKEETRALSPDSVALGFLEAAEKRAQMAGDLSRDKKHEDAGEAMELAIATARVARAAALVDYSYISATPCQQAALDARRDWEDALAMLQQTEKAAGSQARGVRRSPPSNATEPKAESSPIIWLTPENAASLIQEGPDVFADARSRQIPVSDMEHRFNKAQTRAQDPKLKAEESLPYLFQAARAVQEAEYAAREKEAQEVCRTALEEQKTYAAMKDEVLWGMIQLERNMKESVNLELTAERQKSQDRQSELFDALQQMEGKFAQIRQEARGTIVSMGDILFDFNKATLKRQAEFNLVKVSTVLEQFPDMHVYVEGHTDNVGSEEYNQKLSEERAQAVFNFLYEVGVPLERMDWYGFGMTKPVVPNTSAENRAKNRRVDLVLSDEN